MLTTEMRVEALLQSVENCTTRDQLDALLDHPKSRQIRDTVASDPHGLGYTVEEAIGAAMARLPDWTRATTHGDTDRD